MANKNWLARSPLNLTPEVSSHFSCVSCKKLPKYPLAICDKGHMACLSEVGDVCPACGKEVTTCRLKWYEVLVLANNKAFLKQHKPKTADSQKRPVRAANSQETYKPLGGDVIKKSLPTRINLDTVFDPFPGLKSKGKKKPPHSQIVSKRGSDDWGIDFSYSPFSTEKSFEPVSDNLGPILFNHEYHLPGWNMPKKTFVSASQSQHADEVTKDEIVASSAADQKNGDFSNFQLSTILDPEEIGELQGGSCPCYKILLKMMEALWNKQQLESRASGCVAEEKKSLEPRAKQDPLKWVSMTHETYLSLFHTIRGSCSDRMKDDTRGEFKTSVLPKQVMEAEKSGKKEQKTFEGVPKDEASSRL